MNMTELLRPEQRHEEFPITRSEVFLAHAAMSPLPRRVSSAIEGYCRMGTTLGQWEHLFGNLEAETRRYAALIMGCSEEEIAFVASTSMGLSLVAAGLPWQKGDNVVVADGDFPANIYPWLNLERRGVRVKFVPWRNGGVISLDDIKGQIDEHTRLVSLSSVNFVTGFKVDIGAIGQYLREKGILFCVDAVQSLGTLPFDCRHVDFAASSA